MIKVSVKKMYHGYTSVRDYIVNKCIDNNEPLQIEHMGKFMTIKVSSLKVAKQLHTVKIKSKFRRGQEYELVDFKFLSDEEMKKQGDLFGEESDPSDDSSKQSNYRADIDG